MCALYYGLSSWMVPDKTIERRKRKRTGANKTVRLPWFMFSFFFLNRRMTSKKKILFCFFSFQMTGRNCTLFADCLKIEFQKEKKRKNPRIWGRDERLLTPRYSGEWEIGRMRASPALSFSEILLPPKDFEDVCVSQLSKKDKFQTNQVASVDEKRIFSFSFSPVEEKKIRKMGVRVIRVLPTRFHFGY